MVEAREIYFCQVLMILSYPVSTIFNLSQGIVWWVITRCCVLQHWRCLYLFCHIFIFKLTQGEVLPNYFLLRQTIKVEAFFQWWQHNTKPTKKTMETSWFQTNFADYLWMSSFLASQRWMRLECRTPIKVLLKGQS